MALQPTSGLDRLLMRFIDHTVRQNHPERILVKSDQHVAEAATDTTHNKGKRRISMPSSRFDPAIPTIAIRRSDLDRTRGLSVNLSYSNNTVKNIVGEHWTERGLVTDVCDIYRCLTLISVTRT